MSHNVDSRPSSPLTGVDPEFAQLHTGFPRDFGWGVATSSYQIEGAADQDGRGPSIWDTFCATDGKVSNGDDGAVACDHYNRYLDDVALMAELGVKSYRFSLAWPRLFPNGDDQAEPRGFEFYNRLIDALLLHDIKPVITLYHWDLPQPLQDKGGWANRNIIGAFEKYAVACVDAFGDRVKDWITLNEPWVFTWLGNMSGIHAPGLKDLDVSVAATHHTCVAHGVASRSMKARRSDLRIGLALNMTVYRIEDPTHPDLVGAGDLMDSHINRWWLDATVHGKYPAKLVEIYGDRLDRVVKPGDMDLIKVKDDFVGVNYYSDSFITLPEPHDVPLAEGGLFPFPQRVGGKSPAPHTDMGWPVTPNGIGELVLRINRDWPSIPAIMITENGAAYDDGPDELGSVNDHRRTQYLLSHLQSLSDAIQEGAPVSDYFAWSFLDNFEWAEGYAKRFGLVHVDFDTQQRTPKHSAYTYSSLISAHDDFWGLHSA